MLKLGKILEVVPQTLNGVSNILKAKDKGILSSRRTISGAIVAFALAYMADQGVTWEGIALLGIGVLPVALLSFQKTEKTE